MRIAESMAWRPPLSCSTCEEEHRRKYPIHRHGYHHLNTSSSTYIIINFTIINFTIICNPWDTGYILILLRRKNTLHMWADYLQSLTGSSYWPWLTRCLHFALWCDCLFELENPIWTFIAHLDREFIGPVWAKVDVQIELCGPEAWYDLGSATHRSHHTLQHSHCDITTLQ